MPEKTVTLIDNETGTQYTLPIVEGTMGPRAVDVSSLYREAGVFDKAYRLIDKHQQRAEAVADQLQPAELRRLLRYLIDSVLARPAEDGPPGTGIVPAWSINLRTTQNEGEP